MLRLITNGSPGKIAPINRDTEQPRPEPIESGRALVTLASVLAANDAPGTFRQASFLAHLISMKDQHPQTRDRRRVEPREGIAAYRAAAALSDG